MNPRTRVWACLLALPLWVAVLLPACATTKSSEQDAQIVSLVTNSSAFTTTLARDDITVVSRNGTVTLTGMVPDESHRLLAQETAADTPGVRRVSNKLQVLGGAPREGSDEWLSARVKAELLAHRDLSALNTEVSAKDGVVTLKGQADNQAQIDLATEYAKDVKGVRGVINSMTVAGAGNAPRTLGQEVDDASITARVKLSLLTHKSTSALNTQVDTTNGVVTVRGTASSQAEKDLVTKLVTGISGVRGVNNQMVVQSPASFTP